MAIKVGINGFGRIGRLVYRAAMEAPEVEIVAVNDITDAETLAYLLKYDSIHGRLGAEVAADGTDLRVGDRRVKVLAEKNPAALPWKSLGVEAVIESTGLFTDREKAAQHLSAGASRVIVSAPAKNVDATIAIGVNDRSFDPARHTVISTASCTTNCLAPVARVLHDRFRVVKGLMTTVHAYTNDQRILDLPHKDLRRARAAALSIIPTSTGAARAIGLVVPELAGKLDGYALRVPVPDGSVVDLCVEVETETTVEAVNDAFRAAAMGPMKGILRYSEEELVSADIVGDPHSSIVDGKLTAVLGGRLVKVVAWYDNEWGFSNRMVDMLRLLAR
jgi:glyceraldehyde 3-phosphate dehydrogenase